MGRDFRIAARGLRRSPGFSLASVLTLGVGLGCAVAVFGLCYAVLWEPLPYPNANRLVEVRQAHGAFMHLMNSAADVLALRKQELGLQDWALYRYANAALVDATGAEQVAGAVVEPGLLRTLGARPLLGRLLTDRDAQPGSEPVVLISSRLWHRHWAGSANILGQVTQWNGASRRIVGVMPDGFDYPLHRSRSESWLWLNGWVMRDTEAKSLNASLTASNPSEFWLPLRISGAGGDDRSLASVALVMPGATVKQVQQRLNQAMQARAAAISSDANWQFQLTSLLSAQAGDSRPGLLLLLTVAGLLLAVAAANFLGLFQVRWQKRRREIATRMELGASRSRIARLLGTEIVCLGALAAMVGLGMTSLLVAWLRTHAPVDLARLDRVGVNGIVVALTGVGVAACLLPPLLVAFAASWVHPSPRYGAVRPKRISIAVGGMTSQVALSFVLVTAAGLLAVASWRVSAPSLGFAPHQVLRFEVAPLPSRYADSPARKRVYAQATALARRLPGVQSVASALDLPFQGQSTAPYALDGQILELRDARRTLRLNSVSADYFETLRIPIQAGRGIHASDTAGTARIAVLSTAAARQLFPGHSPLGQHVTFCWDGRMECTIVGVVGDVRSNFGLPPSPAAPTVYIAAAQDPVAPTRLMFAVRSVGDLAAARRQLANAFKRWDSTLPDIDVQPLADDYTAAVRAPRFRARIAIGLALLALLLTVIGLYTTLAYRVRMRTSELAVRMAIGARPIQVQRMVLAQSLWQLSPGLVLGLLASPLLGRFMRELRSRVSIRSSRWRWSPAPSYSCGLASPLPGCRVVAPGK